MPNCVVPSCCNRSYMKGKRQEEVEEHTKITFHRFPKAEDRKLQWAKALGLESTTIHKNTYICSLHFPEESFDRTSIACVRLRNHANPCINKTHVSKLQVDSCSSHDNNQAAEPSTSKNVRLAATGEKEVTTKIVASSGEILLPHHGTPKQRLQSEEEYELITPKRRCVNAILDESSVQLRPSTSDVSTQTPAYPDAVMAQERTDGMATAISPNQTWETPSETLLRKAMQHQKETSRKLIQALKKRNRRQANKIAELKSILSDLKAKNLIADE